MQVFVLLIKEDFSQDQKMLHLPIIPLLK